MSILNKLVMSSILIHKYVLLLIRKMQIITSKFCQKKENEREKEMTTRKIKEE